MLFCVIMSSLIMLFWFDQNSSNLATSHHKMRLANKVQAQDEKMRLVLNPGMKGGGRRILSRRLGF